MLYACPEFVSANATSVFFTMMDYMSTTNPCAINGRIRELRIRLYGPRGKSAFARDVGLSPSTYNYYENDRIPPADVLVRIHERTGCDLSWLMTGRANSEGWGPPDRSDSELHRALDTLLMADPRAEAVVRAFVDLLMEKVAVSGTDKPGPGGSTRVGWIPILGRTAAGIVHFWPESALPPPASAARQLDELIRKHTHSTVCDSARGRLAVDGPAPAGIASLGDLPASLVQIRPPDSEVDCVVQFVDCRDLRTLYPDAFALYVDGDSMAPRINDGQIVLVSPSVPAIQGQPAVVQLDDQIGVTCKLFRMTEHDVHLIPINEKYPIQTAPRDRLRWALTVLCHMCL